MSHNVDLDPEDYQVYARYGNRKKQPVKLTIFGSYTDCECDITNAVSRSPDIKLTYYALVDKQDIHNEYHRNMMTKAPNIIINEINGPMIDDVFKHVSTIDNDLILIRHPVWIPNDSRAKELSIILGSCNYCVWTWEWVPNYAMGQMPPLAGWKRIAVTNSEDFKRAKACYPEKQIFILPFGSVPRTPEELQPQTEYLTDLVCDAQPHYECKEFNAVKRNSVDIMVGPAIVSGYKLALWGSRYGDSGICDWASTPKFSPFIRGSFNTLLYPKVYSSAKLYLGVSWNYAHGGFSIRLARALSCGIPVIWHETEGGEVDFPEKVFEWSDSYDKTAQLINYYMDEKNEDKRLELGRKGKEWANKHLDWIKLLKGLAAGISQ